MTAINRAAGLSVKGAAGTPIAAVSASEATPSLPMRPAAELAAELPLDRVKRISRDLSRALTDLMLEHEGPTLKQVIATVGPSVTWREPKIEFAELKPTDGWLRQLGSDLEGAMKREVATDGSDAPSMSLPTAVRCASIVREIERIPAETIEGLKVKALAVHWACEGAPLWAELDTTDIRLARSLIDDLLQIRRSAIALTKTEDDD